MSPLPSSFFLVIPMLALVPGPAMGIAEISRGDEESQPPSLHFSTRAGGTTRIAASGSTDVMNTPAPEGSAPASPPDQQDEADASTPSPSTRGGDENARGRSRVVAAHPGALLHEAQAQRSRGNAAAALALLDTLLVTFPSYPPANLERAELLLDLGRRIDRALEDAKAAAVAFPEEPRAALALSVAAEESGDLDLAIEALRSIAHSFTAEENSGSPSPLTVLRRHAALLARAQRVDEAVRAWETVQKAQPDDPSPHSELARLYELAGHHKRALKAHQSAVAALPDNAPLRRRYADFLERQGNTRQAKAERERADRIAGVSTQKLRELPPSKY